MPSSKASPVARKRVAKTSNPTMDSSKTTAKASVKRRRSSSTKTAAPESTGLNNNVIGAFVALPVEAESGVRYYLFAKEHREASKMDESGGEIETSNGDASDVDEDESDREENAQSTSHTIFVTNVPLFWGEAHLRTFLGRYGQLASVQAGSSRGARFARVRFERSRDARALLRGTAHTTGQQDGGDEVPSEIDIEDAATATLATQTADSKIRENGLRAWVAEARAAKPPRAELKRRSDMFLKEFESREQEEKQMRDANEEQMDADGFTVVKYNKSAKRNKNDSNASASAGVSLLPPTKSASGGRSGGSGRASGGGRMSGKAYNHRKAGKDGFMYSFQVRQAREDRLEKLKLAFEQDKAKVERLKQARRFKPV